MKQLTKDQFPKYTSSSYNSIPEKQTTQSKSGKKRHFSKDYIQMANKDMKRCSNHSLLEKWKLKQWDITSHQSEWPSSKSLQTINTGEDIEKREHSCTLGGNVNWYSHYAK